MCCTSAKSLLRLVFIGGLVLFGGSVRLIAEEASEKADAPAASTEEKAEAGLTMVTKIIVIMVVTMVIRHQRAAGVEKTIWRSVR